MEPRRTFTGYQRQRRTRLAVRLADLVARLLISVGGIGTIVAVSTVFVFLAYVVVPLFESPAVSPSDSLPVAEHTPSPVRVAVDEYRVIGWALTPDGALRVFRLDDGETVAHIRLAETAAVTAVALSVSGDEVTLGFSDGTVRAGHIRFESTLLLDERVPADHRDLALGRAVSLGDAVLARSPAGFRQHRVRVELDPPFKVGTDEPILLLDRATRSGSTVVCALAADHRLHVQTVRARKNLLTNEVTYDLSGSDLVLETPPGRDRPVQLLMSGTADSVFLAWPDGYLQRFDTRDPSQVRAVEEVDLIPDDQARLTALTFLLGRSTLLAGDSQGGLRAWFRVRTETPDAGGDGWRLIAAHELPAGSAAVTSLGSSQRTRVVAVGYANGQVRLYHVTSSRLLVDVSAGERSPVLAVALAPKQDALLALTPQVVTTWNVDLKHPEATLRALFRPVWYEGAPHPAHVWQSSSGDDAFEPKLGLVPLVFGTLKATFYALLFGVPLAILAAVYTSEFLHARWRARIKPTIEMMASLPSVVLGFLAALVIAPFVENIVPVVLTGIFVIPLTFLAGAHLWQLLPTPLMLRLGRWRLLFILAALGLGALAASSLGPLVERLLFSADIRAWLDGQRGTGTGGWLLLLLPLAGVVVALVVSLYVNPWLRRSAAQLDQRRAALCELVKFVAAVLVTILAACAIAALLGALGWDPRGGSSYLGTYVQRNALVVGFIMGFAIIPIIYTLTEDALSSVPEHLRAASLGAGATQWQTAVRIVLPTAMSGVFSAIMIGLGRAVGETMIVLMAAGNTPVMEWNIFSGMRTLAANIAVELPEAPQGSTHYRTLFLSALVLFVLTFVINSAAELVRIRFRARAQQL